MASIRNNFFVRAKILNQNFFYLYKCDEFKIINLYSKYNIKIKKINFIFQNGISYIDRN